jgi:hypothetical protein
MCKEGTKESVHNLVFGVPNTTYDMGNTRTAMSMGDMLEKRTNHLSLHVSWRLRTSRCRFGHDYGSKLNRYGVVNFSINNGSIQAFSTLESPLSDLVSWPPTVACKLDLW